MSNEYPTRLDREKCGHRRRDGLFWENRWREVLHEFLPGYRKPDHVPSTWRSVDAMAFIKREGQRASLVEAQGVFEMAVFIGKAAIRRQVKEDAQKALQSARGGLKRWMKEHKDFHGSDFPPDVNEALASTLDMFAQEVAQL